MIFTIDCASEQIHSEGISDGAKGVLPQMSDICYLQGYCAGMQETRAEIGLKIIIKAEELQAELFEMEDIEYPLLCGECTYLIDKTCALLMTSRSSTNYACDRIVIN